MPHDLGRGVSANGRLSQEAIPKTLSALRQMLQIIREREAAHVRTEADARTRVPMWLQCRYP